MTVIIHETWSKKAIYVQYSIELEFICYFNWKLFENQNKNNKMYKYQNFH